MPSPRHKLEQIEKWDLPTLSLGAHVILEKGPLRGPLQFRYCEFSTKAVGGQGGDSLGEAWSKITGEWAQDCPSAVDVFCD